MAAAKMRTQSRKRVCAGCSQQIKGKIRRGRCENCYRTHLRRVRPGGRAPRPSRPSWAHPGEAALALTNRQSDGCWLYTGIIDKDGYGGEIRIAGHPRMRAHRAVYMYVLGAIPEGMQLDHTCHTADASCPGGVACQHRRCLNPAHLEPVTPTENSARARGRISGYDGRTHCIHGHEFTPENTYLQPRTNGNTSRQCRTCIRDRRAARSAR